MPSGPVISSRTTRSTPRPSARRITSPRNAVLTALVRALRPLDTGRFGLYERSRPDAGPYRPWLLWLGLPVGIAALTRFAERGFAAAGRFPVVPALGTALVLLHRRPAGRGHGGRLGRGGLTGRPSPGRRPMGQKAPGVRPRVWSGSAGSTPLTRPT